MAELDIDHRLLVVKIVYYGPALSGKTTNLIQLHDQLNPRDCGDFMTFETRGDRTLFFDMLPMLVKGRDGFRAKIKLFTVPGQVAHDATRKAVLSRADGVVFVADSQPSQSISNFESFSNLEENAGHVGLDFDHLPLVIQFNKRDLKDVIEESEILDRWQPTGLPVVFSSALYGRAVTETFNEILKKTYRRLDQDLFLMKRFGISEARFLTLSNLDEAV